jgi:hypothetical protein
MAVRRRPTSHAAAERAEGARARRGIVRIGAPANDNGPAAGRAVSLAVRLLCVVVLVAAVAAVLG